MSKTVCYLGIIGDIFSVNGLESFKLLYTLEFTEILVIM